MSLFIVCRKPSGFKPEKEEDLLENPTQKHPNLEVEFFCVPTCFHMRIPKPCLSVRKRNHPSFVNISPTLVIDTSMERSSRVLHHGNPKK